MTRISVGDTFGRLTVIGSGFSKNWLRFWSCLCECGNGTVVRGSYLANGHTRSCGCLWRKHGFRWTDTYESWRGMFRRCYTPDKKHDVLYMSRGIKVCDRWKTFTNFLADMGERTSGTTLDRIDSDKDYGPENCRWATSVEQNNNKRNNHRLSAFGKTMTIAEWCREVNIPDTTIHGRLSRGWSVEEALTR
jgi:hypothetical protein